MNRLARTLRDSPLRWKIVGLMLAAATLSLVLAGAGLLIHTRAAFEKQIERRMTLLADTIGLNSTAALAFNDATAATENLAVLRISKHVIAGGLYDQSGALFARYRRADAGDAIALPASIDGADHWTLGDRAVLQRRILRQDRAVGEVVLIADTGEWRGTLNSFLRITGVLCVGILALGLLVSLRTQRLITGPIVDLSNLMRRVRQERNYHLRAAKIGNDELGTLVDGFNDMLAEIGASRAELERTRDDLRRLNVDLEQRVLDRTRQLEEANKELEAFSYSVSHDLRAPLRAIDGFSRLLLADQMQNLDASGRDNLERVRRGAQRMGQLIDDLLRLARVTRTEPISAPVDLGQLADEVIAGLRAQTPERQVEFKLARGLIVSGDQQLLRAMLENLLGNAWKFTGARTNAQIEFGIKMESEGPVYFVRDNGAGFDMTYAGKLFTPFQRLHSMDEFPGTGVGLATVQRIVRKHGGRIWPESAVGKGATFYFTLPGSKTADTQRDHASAERPHDA